MGYIAVIGAGSWGTTLANLVAKKGYDVSLWVYEKELMDIIREKKVNEWYLPEIVLSDNIRVTDDIQDAVTKARFIINVVPTQFIRKTYPDNLTFRSDAVIINASKGIENGTLLTPSSILREKTKLPVCALSGPSFAKEVARELPAAVTLASTDRDSGLIIQDMLSTDYFRVYLHDDIIGVELGGALKNVIAIGAGIADGLGLGYSARASLITRGLVEIIRLGVEMGASEKTFSGLSGIGDLILTCTSPLSRNYTFGTRLGKGERIKDILSCMKEVVEGVETTGSAWMLSNKHCVDMPITEKVYEILYLEKDPGMALRELLSRTLKEEFYGPGVSS